MFEASSTTLLNNSLEPSGLLRSIHFQTTPGHSVTSYIRLDLLIQCAFDALIRLPYIGWLELHIGVQKSRLASGNPCHGLELVFFEDRKYDNEPNT